MSVGPIPWTAIFQYGSLKGLENDVLDAFIGVIMGLDGIYLERIAFKQRQESNQTKSGEPNGRVQHKR